MQASRLQPSHCSASQTNCGEHIPFDRETKIFGCRAHPVGIRKRSRRYLDWAFTIDLQGRVRDASPKALIRPGLPRCPTTVADFSWPRMRGYITSGLNPRKEFRSPAAESHHADFEAHIRSLKRRIGDGLQIRLAGAKHARQCLYSVENNRYIVDVHK